MIRRNFLLLTGAAMLGAAAHPVFAAPVPPKNCTKVQAGRTSWRIISSQGLDALCFLGPLSADPFYARYYAAELEVFRRRLKASTLKRIAALSANAKSHQGMLGPDMCLLCSGGPTDSLEDVIGALTQAETVLRPPFAASAYWDLEAWDMLLSMRGDLILVLKDMKAAGFVAFRDSYMAPRVATRFPLLKARLAAIDVISQDEKMTGRRLRENTVDVVQLYFSKPHGIRIQGQRFLSHIDYPQEISIRVAIHELMHPPFDGAGAPMQAVFAFLRQDDLLKQVVKEHNPSFGYNSLEGYLNEDVVQALDQFGAEAFAVAKDPAERWHDADDGMHILAAGLYGLLKAEGYDQTGGNIEAWLRNAIDNGKLSPASWQRAAAQVLKVAPDALWLAKAK